MKVILMRGVSGSGKSTLARMLAEGRQAAILSTDDYFTVNGKYEFDPKMIGVNHRRNQERARVKMREKIPLIIIDNTHTQAWEMKPYVLSAIEFGYEVEIHEAPELTLEELLERQKNREDQNKNLPKEVIERMLARYQKDVKIKDILESDLP
jgi:NEDD4-binding protein 2